MSAELDDFYKRLDPDDAEFFKSFSDNRKKKDEDEAFKPTVLHIPEKCKLPDKGYSIEIERFYFEFLTSPETTTLQFPHSINPYDMEPGKFLHSMSHIAFYRLPVAFSRLSTPKQKESFENQANARVKILDGEEFTVDFSNKNRANVDRYYFLLYDPREITQEIEKIDFSLLDFKWSVRLAYRSPTTALTMPLISPWNENLLSALSSFHMGAPDGNEICKISKGLTPELNRLRGLQYPVDLG